MPRRTSKDLIAALPPHLRRLGEEQEQELLDDLNLTAEQLGRIEAERGELDRRELRQRIGTFVKQVREKKGLTRAELANLLEAPEAGLAEFEEGAADPDLRASHLQAFDQVLNISAATIMTMAAADLILEDYRPPETLV